MRMTDPAPRPSQKRFFAYAEHAGRAHGHLVTAPSYEAAAIGYAELYSPPPDEGAEVRILVDGLDDRQRHCFTVDLGGDHAEPC
jgi:hypothetical protein